MHRALHPTIVIVVRRIHEEENSDHDKHIYEVVEEIHHLILFQKSEQLNAEVTSSRSEHACLLKLFILSWRVFVRWGYCMDKVLLFLILKNWVKCH